MNIHDIWQQEQERFQPQVQGEDIIPAETVRPTIQMPVYTPPQTVVPSLQEQAQQAMGLNDMAITPQKAEPYVPEKTYEERLKEKIDAIQNVGRPALMALIDQSQPELDEKKQKRLKFAAAANALGQGMSTIYQGVAANNGNGVINDLTSNTYTAKALDEYNKNIQADKEAKYKTALAKAQILQADLNQAQQSVEREITAENADKSLDKRLKSQDERYDKRLKLMAELDAKKQSGKLTFEEQKQLKQMQYDNAEEERAERLNLEKQRQGGKISLAQYNAGQRRINEEYKSNYKTVTEETDPFTGETKTKTTTKTPTKPYGGKSSETTPVEKKASPKKVMTEEEKLKSLGITPVGKIKKKK